MSNVVCLLNVEADRATFTWSEGPASFEPYTLDGMVYKDFKEIAAEAREKLADLVKDYLFDEQAMPKSAFALAEAGHELYQAMFQPGAEQARQARQVRKWLEELAQQREVDTLEIVVESPWSLSWNIIYDQKPDKAAFLSGDDNPDRWKPFWGLRYNLAGGRKVDPLRRMPLLNDPKVLLVVDPEIRDGLPDEQQQRLAEFVETHEVQLVHSKDALQEAITNERPDLLYWLSHASADALVLAGEEISPRNMRKLLRQDDDEHFGGLAFLNACQTAEGGESGSFFEAFHNVGFAGMIGTEHQTVDQFAHPLGLDFLEAFLDRGEPVGSALRKLRGRVPLGLLYGTYCPPEIRVDQGDIRDSVNIRQVYVQGVALSARPTEDDTATRTLPPLPDEPYRSLAYYDREDRALFAGRDDDIERFATYLDDASTRILVLHGESGVGKSSFLHAGVIPYLEEECLGYRFIRDRAADDSANAPGSVIFIRATNDLFGQLAQALCEFCARPYEYQTPLGEKVSADLPGVLGELIGDDADQGNVRAALRSDSSLLGRIMSAISDHLPFSAILVIDQGEEVFTLAQTPEDQQCGRQALDMLRRTVGAAGDFKVIFSLRTEYYGRVIDRLRRGLHDAGRIREYLLTDFDELALLEAIRRPTASEPISYTCEVPFEKYGFRYAEGVAEEISHRVVRYTTQRRDSVLPLMQVICTQLYRLAKHRADKTITLADLEALGGIQGGMRNHVESLLAELLKGRPLDKRPVQELFTQLYLKQPDGTLTTALLTEDEVEKRWTGEMPFDKLLRASQATRLLKINTLRIGNEVERRYVSLGHDALAKLAADWDEELSRFARIRKMALAIGAVSTVAIVMAVLAVTAHQAKQRAEVDRRKAVSARNDAEKQEQVAITARKAADRSTYNLRLARVRDLYPGKIDEAQAVLNQQVPDTLLDFSWRYYDRLCNRKLETLCGHRGIVNCVRFSPDGKTMASASDDKSIIVWDPQNWSVKAKLTGHTDEVLTLCFSSDNRHFASGSKDGTVKVWNFEKEPWLIRSINVRPFKAGKFPQPVQFLPDGKRLATIDKEGVHVTIWDAASGTELASFPLIGTPVAFASCQPNTLIVGYDDGTIQLSSLDSQSQLVTETRRNCHAGAITAMTSDYHGSRLVTASKDQRIVVWNTMPKENQVNPLEKIGKGFETTKNTDVDATAVTPDGSVIAWGEKSRIEIRELGSAKRSLSLTSGMDHLSLSFSPDARTLVSANVNWTGTVWNASIEPFKLVDPAPEIVPYKCAITPDGRRIARVAASGRVELIDRETSTPPSFFDTLHASPDWLSMDGELIMLASELSQFVTVWNTASGTEAARFTSEYGDIAKAALSPDGKHVAVSSENHLQLWEIGEDKPRADVVVSDKKVLHISFSPDGKMIGVADNSESLRILDAVSLAEVVEIQRDVVLEYCVFSPNSQQIAIGASNGSIHIATLGEDQTTPPIPAHVKKVSKLAWSHDGRTLASCTDATDGIKLWDPVNGQLRGILDFGPVDICEMTFDKSSDSFVSVDDGGEIREW